MTGGRVIQDITLPATSNGTGTKQTTVFDPLDLSRGRQLEATLKVTAAASGASDVLDVRIQDTDDGVVWNDRIRFLAVAGNQAVSPAYIQRAVLTNSIPLQSSEKDYIESGASGGSAIAAGTVVNGPFPPPVRAGVTTTTRTSSWRAVFIQTDVSGTASYTAELIVRLHSEGVGW